MQSFRTSTFSIQSLLRKRPKIKPETILHRKELKRTKHMNLFTPDHSGEKPVHEWMQGKRVKAVFSALQEFKNRNRHTNPVDPKDHAKMKKISEEFAEYAYRERQLADYQQAKAHEMQKHIAGEIDKLPGTLKDELRMYYKQTRRTMAYRPELDPYHYYFEQFIRVMPKDIEDRWFLAERLGRIANDELPVNE
mmetsp:Transcript_71497/g.83174  ORF Transcript_71497/g.83174 Transcript_71497/m.83174 type:complete len:193 (+) Transcript_71497:38-616(+)